MLKKGGAMRAGSFSLCILFLFGLWFAHAFSSEATPRKTALLAGQFLDIKEGKLLNDITLLIEGEKILAIGRHVKIPEGTNVIDLSHATVLPGLIDCHTHITVEPGDYYENLFRKSPIDFAVVAPVYARKTLEAGFTSIRDLWAMEFIDVALKNAINSGKILGPRMQVATLALGATGGHNDTIGFSPYLKLGYFSGLADGVDEIRKAIRFQIKHGADVIKVMATAGVLSEEESAGNPQYTQEELNALVDEATMWGKKVAAHAHGLEGIKRAIRAGVSSIEHGCILDDESIQMMKDKGTYLVADIYNDEFISAEYRRLNYPEKMLEKEKLLAQTQRENFRRAALAGVKIAFGSDAGVYPHGWNGKQFKYMVQWGLTPMQAIQSATISAADLLGWQDKVGALEPGLYADVIAVASNPLDNITVLESVGFVMKGGQVVKDELSKK